MTNTYQPNKQLQEDILNILLGDISDVALDMQQFKRKIAQYTVDAIMQAVEEHTKAEMLQAVLDELEALDRASEVVGIGYAIVRAETVHDRINSLRGEIEG